MRLSLQSGAWVRPYPGLASSGDAAVCLPGPDPGSGAFVVIDALGHGPDAARSAERAASVLREAGPLPLRELFLACDQALVGLREVVMSAIRVSSAEGKAWFAGVGNVEIIGPAQAARPVPTPGRLGRGLRSLKEWPLPTEPGHRWVLASDGLRGRDLRRAFDAALKLPPQEAAQQLVATAGRPDDDASALVLDLLEVAS
jgi:hypothetical protein